MIKKKKLPKTVDLSKRIAIREPDEFNGGVAYAGCYMVENEIYGQTEEKEIRRKNAFLYYDEGMFEREISWSSCSGKPTVKRGKGDRTGR
jgi:hypothetical protein